MKRIWIWAIGLACVAASGCAGKRLSTFGDMASYRVASRLHDIQSKARPVFSSSTGIKTEANNTGSGNSSVIDFESGTPADSISPTSFSERGGVRQASFSEASVLQEQDHEKSAEQASSQPTGERLFGEAGRVIQSHEVNAERNQHNSVSQEAVPSLPFATEASTEHSYSLSDIEQWALAHNPSLAAAQAAVCKAEGFRHQVGIRPNPSFGYFAQQLADRGTDQHGLFLEREFVRGEKLRLNRAVLSHTSSAQQRELEAQLQRVLTDVRVVFYEAVAAQQQVEAARLLQAAAQRGVEIARDRMQAEEGSRIEVLQSETLFSEITLTVERKEIAYRAAWNDLAAVAGLPANVSIQLVGDLEVAKPEFQWDAVYEQIILQSPELSAARAIVCEKAAMVQRQQVQAIPNITGQLGAGYDNGTNSGLINVQVSAPIPTANKNLGNISAANADYQLAVENVKRIEQSIKSRLARVAQEYESSLASVKKYEHEIIPKSASGLELSEAAYRAGELDFLQVLILRRSYFESMIRCIESKAQLAQANAKIDGLLLTGGLTEPQDFTSGDGIRGSTFGAQ